MSLVNNLAEHHPGLHISKLAAKAPLVGVSWVRSNFGDLGGGQFHLSGGGLVGDFGFGDHERRRIVVGLAGSQNAFGYERPWLLCPQCKGNCGVVYWKSLRWLCRACHGFSYLSQYRTADDRLRDKYMRIVKQVEHGRPAGMRKSTWDALIEELETLRLRLTGRTLLTTRNDLDQSKVTASYVALSEDS